MKRHFARTLVSLALVGAAFCLPASTLAQTSETGIGGRPAFPDKDNPRTSSIFIYEPKPGTVVNTGVVVTNNSSRAATIRVYGVDAEIASEGAFSCKQLADAPSAVGKWMKFAKKSVFLNPGQKEMVPFRIVVPKNLSAGEYNGCVIIQEKRAPIRGSQGVALSFRSALRVAVTIPGVLHKKLSITRLDIRDLTVQSKEEKIVLHPALRNDGNVSLDTNVKVKAARFLWFGTAYEKSGTYPILSRSTAEYNFEMEKSPWGGLYRGTVSAQYDPNPKHQLGTPAKKVAAAQAVHKWFIVWPAWWAALIELLILAALAYLVRRYIQHRRQLWSASHDWLDYTVKRGETIQDIAARGNISWKTLARVNELKPPYAVAEGQKLQVPADSVEVPGMILGGEKVTQPRKSTVRKKPAGKKAATRTKRPKKRP